MLFFGNLSVCIYGNKIFLYGIFLLLLYKQSKFDNKKVLYNFLILYVTKSQIRDETLCL